MQPQRQEPIRCVAGCVPRVGNVHVGHSQRQIQSCRKDTTSMSVPRGDTHTMHIGHEQRGRHSVGPILRIGNNTGGCMAAWTSRHWHRQQCRLFGHYKVSYWTGKEWYLENATHGYTRILYYFFSSIKETNLPFLIGHTRYMAAHESCIERWSKDHHLVWPIDGLFCFFWNVQH